MTDPTYYTGSDDRELSESTEDLVRDILEADSCIFCGAFTDEPHDPACPMAATEAL